jgi:Lrp/AsnC family leucine-responsive transcriptional regulator
MRSSGKPDPVKLDSLDLSILEKLLVDAQTTFKELARETNTDQRTIALRFRRMLRQGVIRRVTIDVDWSKIGLSVTALIGSTTSEGEDKRNKLLGLIRNEPRILEAFATMGSHEYFIRAVGIDIASVRKEISARLEPLTSKLDTSMVVETMKAPNYKGLMKYLRVERA